MSTSRADRELLFGLLAFNNGFIDRETLIGAFQSWMADKSYSLSSRLRETGKLPADQADLLDALVKIHIQQHDNDPQKSLGDITSLGNLQQKLTEIADSELFVSLVQVGSTRRVSPKDCPTVIPHLTSGPEGVKDASNSEDRRFRILRPHARGGLGTVYVAVDGELNREVAIKEIHPQHADKSDNRERFVREALVTGGLEHPNIVPVYGLGTYADGRPYYAMRFIKGDSLQGAIEAYHIHKQEIPNDAAKLNLELRNLLGRFIDVCNAVSYAHSRGILHRDLKPGNIMLGKYGETLVVDWGLAKPIGRSEGRDESTEVTLSPSGSGSCETIPGSAVGTPAFMSPEQAEGKIAELGPATDVYSLGATLYQLLSGRIPFQGDVREVLKQVVEGKYPRPREVCHDVAPSLEAICRKAMALSPNDRYSSPRMLADDIEHWLADEPVSSYPEPFKDRMSRWSRKHRTWVMSAGALLFTAVISLTIGNLLLAQANIKTAEARDDADLQRRVAVESEQKAKQEKDRAESEQTRAELAARRAIEQSRLAERHLYLARMNQAQIAWENSQVMETRRLLDLYRIGADVRQGIEDLRGFEWFYLNALSDGALHTFGDDKRINSVVFTADGTEIVVASETGGIQILRSQRDRRLGILADLFTDVGPVKSISITSDGQLFAIGYSDGIVSVRSREKRRQSWKFNAHTQGVNSVALSPDAQKIASGSDDHTISLREIGEAGRVLELLGHSGPVLSVSFSPEGKRIVSGSSDKSIKIWDAISGQTFLTLTGHTSAVNSVSFDSDAQRVVSGSSDGTIKVWDARNGQLLLTFSGHTNSVNSVAFRADGQHIASGSSDGKVKVWNLSTGTELLTLKKENGQVTNIAFSPDGKKIVSGFENGSVTVWDVDSGEVILDFRDSMGRPNVAISPDGRLAAVITAHRGRTLTVWDTVSGQKVSSFQANSFGPSQIEFSSDGKCLALDDSSSTVIWNLESRQKIGIHKKTSSQPGVQPRIPFSMFSPDGKWIAVCGYKNKTGMVEFWSTETREEAPKTTIETNLVNGVLFSPDGKKIAVNSGEEAAASIKMWESETGKELRTLDESNFTTHSFSFSPNSKLIAATSENAASTELKVWEIESGKLFRKFNGTAFGMRNVSFSPDGTRLVIDGTPPRMWEIESGREIPLPDRSSQGENLSDTPEHGDGNSVSFSPDGKRIATANQDHSVTVYELDRNQPLLTVKGHQYGIANVTFSSDGKRLFTRGSEGVAKVWDAENALESLILKADSRAANGVSFSPDGHRVVTAGESEGGKLWDLDSGKMIREFKDKSGSQCAKFSPDGKYIASDIRDSGVKIWDSENGQEILGFEGKIRNDGFAFSPDGKYFGSGGKQNDVGIWDMETGRQILTLKGHGRQVNCVAFSQDGKRLASGSQDSTVKVWDVATGKELLTYLGATNRVFALSFMPDGKRIVSGGLDEIVSFWDASSGRDQLSLTGAASCINRVALSPDGKRIAVATEHQLIKLWDTEIGQVTLILNGHAGFVYDVSFSPDGSKLASASSDGTVRIWGTGSDHTR